MNCELVVLGAGGSGLVAAVKAADVIGKKVIVLEKAKKPGGATTFAHGLQITNSKWQIAAGITAKNSGPPSGASGPPSGGPAVQKRVAGDPAKGGSPGHGSGADISGQFFDWLVEKRRGGKTFQDG